MEEQLRIFLTGATGAIGTMLLPQLIAEGHCVFAATREAGKFAGLAAAGANPVLCDVLQREGTRKAVAAARPDVVVHEVTVLREVRNFRHFDTALAQTNQVRTQGLDNLIEAAREAGASRFLAQSYGGWPVERVGDRIKTETAPLDSCPPGSMSQSLAAIRHVETTVPKLGDLKGGVLRYGQLYGPGTGFSPSGAMVQRIRQRALPLIGDASGIWSFLHVSDAATATRLAITREASGLYNVVDNEPAAVSEWLPYLAQILGAKPPRHIPAWLGRLLAGEGVVMQMTSIRGLSNAKVKADLNWSPDYETWRTGFPLACL